METIVLITLTLIWAILTIVLAIALTLVFIHFDNQMYEKWKFWRKQYSDLITSIEKQTANRKRIHDSLKKKNE